jgi:DNA-binding CsgD family transcriptional regulator
MSGTVTQIGPLPLVGRAREMQALHATLDSLGGGKSAVWMVSGDGGVGKTRLGRELLGEAARRGMSGASARAYPVEAGVPYALFADALLPWVRRLDRETMLSLTRGVDELSLLFPWLAEGPATQPLRHAPDFRNRLHWHFTQFVRALASKEPLVVVLEDLQWADSSSLELLHFVVRQTADVPLMLYCTYNPDREHPATLTEIEQSLTSLGIAQQHRLLPLKRSDVADLVQQIFSADPGFTEEFVSHLYEWTRGNPFFLEETLKALVASGDLHRQEDRWTGWRIDRMRLPGTVRDAVLARVSRLGPDAREVAEVAAVLGSRVRAETIAAVMERSLGSLIPAIEELRRAHVLEETVDGDEVLHDFPHPIQRETLYRELGALRARFLHSAVASALERSYGDRALDHADELAYHFSHARTGDASKAGLYLRAAGRRALEKYANQEAADYLATALDLRRQEGRPDDEEIDLLEDLARARQRLGEYDVAIELWRAAQAAAVERSDWERAAKTARRMGMALFWSGRPDDALEQYRAGLDWARQADATEAEVRVGIVLATALQEIGRLEEALSAAHDALHAAGPDAAPALLGRVHRSLLQIHLWAGNATESRAHGARALELAEQSGDRVGAFLAHWAMGVLEGFSGYSPGIEYHLEQSTRLAGELRSPVLRAWIAELDLEYASARGDWEHALRVGEEAIRLARALNQQTLLPRLLVWTGLIHVVRSDYPRGEAYIDEAWRIAGAGTDHPTSIHAVLPAYIGRAGLHLARGDYYEAIRIGQEGIELADRTGYVLWTVHRLLPIVGESYLWLRQMEGARHLGARLRRDAERLGHRLGMAWATACDALLAWLEGDTEHGADLLRRAAEELEALPFLLDATRIRRQLAGRLADLGDREGAVKELRTVHDRLLRLGAEVELRKARDQFREVGARPPPLGVASRSGGLLTARELAVASQVAQRKSSKSAARELKISVRTVDAHLANIYRKLAINSRAELSELYRLGELAHEP